ncbi:uncharacterized protein LOC110751684 [Prunus avium]|uniref:Uncharacterized protein LOC110751684 n=1 Tax=Prunus avium TaxID=42229 RepID=A0A6P5S1T6_PRUAV|nr:uncharacterized protein LOC110751684 [Prunus avium]
MKLLVWNSRGSAWRGFVLQALFYISTLCLDLFCILDSRASRAQADRLAQRLGFNNSVPAIGQCGGIILLWNPSILNINILNYHERYINCRIQELATNKVWLTTFVYAYPQKTKQISLWTELSALKPLNHAPWLLLGDFNNICSLNEKIGGSQVVSQAMMNFNKFLNDCEVLSMNASGVPFTWCNGHHDNSIIYERLDRALANPNWMSLYPHCELQNLPILRSDHGPILLTCSNHLRRVPEAFRFEAMWLAHKDFDKVVTQTWNNNYSGNAAQKIQTCCNTFKHQLKSWNRNVFGDLFQKIKTAQETLQSTQEQLAQNPYSPYLLDKDSKLNTELKLLLEQEETFYARKCPWFKADQAPNQHSVTDFLQIVEPCVTNQDNVNLLAPVSDLELEHSIKGIGPLKAPGPDGLQAIFYHKCWENTKQMVKNLVNDFPTNNIPLQDVNHTNIALIPKVDSLETVNHYRPISLCNVSYKVITKILVNRLKPILSNCISKNQGAFAPGRSIFDNILIAHELFHDFKRKKGARGAMAIKLDLEKAYDLLDWGYIRDYCYCRQKYQLLIGELL